MDLMLILGLLIAFVSFYFGVPDLRVDLLNYLDANSFILVFGGTIAATVISSSKSQLQGLLTLFKQMVITPKEVEPYQMIGVLVKIAEKAQSTSKQALVNEAGNIDDGFLRRALELVGAGLDKEFIRNTLETDIFEIERRHQLMAGTVRSMGTFAPMFGMTGTVLGVTKVLKNVTDITNIVDGMSLALLTTLYGLVLSAILFIPLTNKLRSKTAREMIVKEMILEGVIMIYDKEIPLKVEKYLQSYLKTKFKKSEKK